MPEVLEATEERLVLERIDDGGAPIPRCSAGPSRELHLAGRAGVRRAAAGRARAATGSRSSSSPAANPSDWPAFYAELPRCCRSPARAAASRRCASGSPTSPGPPEPPARLHGDLWGGNVWATT